jgi:hypothetical protein
MPVPFGTFAEALAKGRDAPKPDLRALVFERARFGPKRSLVPSRGFRPVAPYLLFALGTGSDASGSEVRGLNPTTSRL